MFNRSTDKDDDEKKEKKKERKEKPKKHKREDEDEAEWQEVRRGVAIPSVSHYIYISKCKISIYYYLL